MCLTFKYNKYIFFIFPFSPLNVQLDTETLGFTSHYCKGLYGTLRTEFDKLWETTCVNTMKNLNIYPLFGTMKLLLSIIVHSGPTGQQKWLISDRVYQTEQLQSSYQRKAAIWQLNLQEEGKKRMTMFAFKLAQSAINSPVWWHCRGQNSISPLLSSSSPPSCSSLHPACQESQGRDFTSRVD